MTPLRRVLVERIEAAGPITIAEFMSECLMNPDHGYYRTRDPFGSSGDFTTSPEISQMFGEVIGLAMAQAWLDCGRPTEVVLVELGPGRGTLMKDVLRACRAVPVLADVMSVHLVEASEALRARQRETLSGQELAWHNDLSTLPHGSPAFMIANEFFDALPSRQFVRAGDGWRERVIGAEGCQLRFGLAPPAPQPGLADRLGDTGEGDLVEVCPAGVATAAEIGGRIAKDGGFAIIVDYGGRRSLGDTLQAIRRHDPVDPLEAIGDADITAHVDFHAIAGAAERSGAQVSKLITQGVFLERLGITARARRLAEGLSGARLEAHVAAHRRLTHPEEMGSLFKAIAIHDGTLPPGFDE
jgi:NADH dehydrogenase [ubiquinone] 1 alpha subcomplex assembly factor 7